MKKIIITAFIMSGLMIFSSCKKVLDYTPPGVLSSADFSMVQIINPDRPNYSHIQFWLKCKIADLLEANVGQSIQYSRRCAERIV